MSLSLAWGFLCRWWQISCEFHKLQGQDSCNMYPLWPQQQEGAFLNHLLATAVWVEGGLIQGDVLPTPKNVASSQVLGMELNKNGAFRNSERWVLEADYLVPRCALVGIAAYNTLWVKGIFWAWLSLLRALQCFLCWGLEISEDWGVGGGEDYGRAMWRGQEDGSNRFVMYHLCPWMASGQWPVWAENLI